MKKILIARIIAPLDAAPSMAVQLLCSADEQTTSAYPHL
jgi:hypothetical protein